MVGAWPTDRRSPFPTTIRPPTSSSKTRWSATAKRPSIGKRVFVHYAGVAWSNGKEFDASWNRGDTFDFRLGAREVIEGWDKGVAGMRVGGRRRLTIPPHLGYGSRGAGGVIKGGETLVFVVDLMNVR